MGLLYAKQEGKMRAEFLECCGRIVSTANQTYVNILRFKSKKFYKKYTSNKMLIKKEIVLLTRCQNCNHIVLKFLWYVSSNDQFSNYVESKVIKGKIADKIFEERRTDWIFYRLPAPVLTDGCGKQSKKVPWVYGKTLNDGLSQVPRYIDETDNAGHKIASPTIITKI